MTTPKLTKEEYQRVRPKWGCLVLAAPILAVPLMLLAYVYTFYSGYMGVPAAGETVSMQFEGCEQAGALVLARAEDMGLAQPELSSASGGFLLRAGLPDRPHAAEHIAATLARQGTFAVRAGDLELANQADILNASVRADITMSPYTLINLNDQARDRIFKQIREVPRGHLQIWIEGAEAWSYGNQRPMTGGEIEVPPDAVDDRARMELAASRAIALNTGPLPCAVSLKAITTVSPAGE